MTYIHLQISLGKVHFKKVCNFFSLKFTVVNNKFSRFGGQGSKYLFSCVYKSRTKGHRGPLGWSLVKLMWIIGYSKEVLVEEADSPYLNL